MPHLITAVTTEEATKSYIINLDGTETESPAQITDPQTGEKRLFFDLTGLAEGDHTVTIQGKGLWGVSPPTAPFDFTVELPSTPSGVGLEA